MASGEVAKTIDPADLPYGLRDHDSGRISGVTEPGELSVHYPFPVKDLVVLDDALKYGSRAVEGPLRRVPGRSRRRHRRHAPGSILATVPTPDNAVLLAVSPNQKAIEVVYGAEVKGRGIEEAAPLGVSGGCGVVQGGQPDRRPDQRGARAVRAGVSPA